MSDNYDDENNETLRQEGEPEPENHEIEGDRGVPSVSGAAQGNSLFKKLVPIGFVVLALLMLLFMVLPSGGGHQKQKPQLTSDTSDATIGNNLPALKIPKGSEDSGANNNPFMPDKPKPPQAPTKPVAVQPAQGMTPQQKRQARALAKRRAAPLVVYKTSTRASQSQGSANQPTVKSMIAKNPYLSKILDKGNSGSGGSLFGGGSSGGSSLSGNLQQATPNKIAQAYLLPDRDFLITKGTFIDCVLETRIDTSHSGFTSCRVTTNVYSDNGRVLLIERGSEVTGSYKAKSVKPGINRVFVAWDRLTTPNGVAVNLSSPGIGPLGASGLSGRVDNHFLQRFGAALFLSVFDDYANYLIAKQKQGNSLDLSSSGKTTQKLASIALKHSIGIKPTLYKHQGDHIKIYVAHDIDFSNVYGLRRTND